jgi:ceramide kinase
LFSSSFLVLLSFFRSGFNRPKNLLVFINPFGGKKKAPQIYREKVEPILRLSGINYTVILTQRANHARDLLLDIESNDLCDYHGFVCVGGDGMFAELLNGMIIRRQKQEGVDYMSPSVSLSRPVVPVGVIPAGSTDAVSFGVTGINDPVTSTVHVIFGKTINIDISAVHENSTSEGKLLRYATSVLGYGFLADVLVDSEKNRWMGPKRYDWAGFKKLLSLKAYEGEIKLRISTSDGSPRDSDLCQSDCTLCANSGLRSKFAGENALIHDHQHQLQEEQHKKEEGPAVETNLDNDSSVVTIRGKFLSVNAATMSCRCEKSKKGLSPAAHLGNGCSDLIIVSQCSRLDYIRFLMRTGYSTSESPVRVTHVSHL